MSISTDAGCKHSNDQVSPAIVDSVSSARLATTTAPNHAQSLPPIDYLNGPLTDEMVRLMMDRLVPSEREMAAMDMTVERLNACVRACFHGKALLHAFGSSASGMWLKGSADMDLCLTLHPDLERELSLRMEQENEEIRLHNETVAHQLKELKALAKSRADKPTDVPSDPDDKENELSPSTEDRPRYKDLVTVASLVLERLGDFMEKGTVFTAASF
jgi:hypothetical protein